jgi:hypothetical protein
MKRVYNNSLVGIERVVVGEGREPLIDRLISNLRWVSWKNKSNYSSSQVITIAVGISQKLGVYA